MLGAVDIGKAGQPYIVRKTVRAYSVVHGTGVPAVYRFHVTRLNSNEVALTAGSTGIWIMDNEVLAAAQEFAFLDLVSSVRGVQWWPVDAASPITTSTLGGPKRHLRPCAFSTELPFSAGSRPAVVFYNPTVNPAFVRGTYARRTL